MPYEEESKQEKRKKEEQKKRIEELKAILEEEELKNFLEKKKEEDLLEEGEELQDLFEEGEELQDLLEEEYNEQEEDEDQDSSSDEYEDQDSSSDEYEDQDSSESEDQYEPREKEWEYDPHAREKESEYDPHAREKESDKSLEEFSKSEKKEEHLHWVELYYQLFLQRCLFLGRALEKQPADQIMKCMIYLNEEEIKKDFSFFICCRGGGLRQGVAVYDVMNFVTVDITTFGYGLNASMGAFLIHGGTVNKRKVSKHSRVMIHQPRMSPYDYRWYSGIESASEAEKISRLRTYVLDAYIKKTKEEPEIIEYLMERDVYLLPEEAIGLRLIDQILIEGFGLKQ